MGGLGGTRGFLRRPIAPRAEEILLASKEGVESTRRQGAEPSTRTTGGPGGIAKGLLVLRRTEVAHVSGGGKHHLEKTFVTNSCKKPRTPDTKGGGGVHTPFLK